MSPHNYNITTVGRNRLPLIALGVVLVMVLLAWLNVYHSFEGRGDLGETSIRVTRQIDGKPVTKEVSVDLAQTTTRKIPNLMYPLIFATLWFVATGVVWLRFSSAALGLLPVIALLNGLGWVMLYRLAPDLAVIYRNPGLRFLARDQLMWTSIALVGMVVVAFGLTDSVFNLLRRWRNLYVILSVLLLLLTLLIGVEINNRRLWLKLGPIVIQTVEIVKVLIVLYLASYFADRAGFMGVKKFGPITIPEIRHLGPFVVMCGLSLFPLFAQKDFGPTLLLLATFLIMFYVGSGHWRLSLFGGILCIGAIVLLYQLGTPAMLRVRVEAWLHPFTRSENITQSLWAFASGGFTGAGLGEGLPQYIPEVQSDFNFAAIGEEMGYIGSVTIIALYILLLILIGRIALRCTDTYKKLLATGIMILFTIQTTLIMAGTTGVFLFTGITMPFISYGGSSLAISMGLVGVLIRISSDA